jgi:hypothetical protein
MTRAEAHSKVTIRPCQDINPGNNPEERVWLIVSNSFDVVNSCHTSQEC